VVNALVPMALAVNLCRVEFKLSWTILTACPLLYALLLMPVLRKIFLKLLPDLSRTDRGQMLLCCTGHAVTLVGYPITSGFFGKEGLAMAAAYDLGNFSVAYLFTYTVATIYKPSKHTATLSDIEGKQQSECSSRPSASSVSSLSDLVELGGERYRLSDPGCVGGGNVVDIDYAHQDLKAATGCNDQVTHQRAVASLDGISIVLEEDDVLATVCGDERFEVLEHGGPRARGFTEDILQKAALPEKPRSKSLDNTQQIRHMHTIAVSPDANQPDNTSVSSGQRRKTITNLRGEMVKVYSSHGSSQARAFVIPNLLFVMLKRIILLPPTIGFLIGIGMRAIETTTEDLPVYVENVMVNTSKCTSILTIFGLGMFFQPALLLEKKYACRLLVLFLVKYGFALMVGLTTYAFIRDDEPVLPLIMTVSLLMPTPPAVIAYAGEFGYDQVFASLVVNAGLVVSFFLAFVVALVLAPE